MIIKNAPVPRSCRECDSWGLSDVVTIDCPVDRDGSLYSFSGRPEGCPLTQDQEQPATTDCSARPLSPEEIIDYMLSHGGTYQVGQDKQIYKVDLPEPVFKGAKVVELPGPGPARVKRRLDEAQRRLREAGGVPARVTMTMWTADQLLTWYTGLETEVMPDGVLERDLDFIVYSEDPHEYDPPELLETEEVDK